MSDQTIPSGFKLLPDNLSVGDIVLTVLMVVLSVVVFALLLRAVSLYIQKVREETSSSQFWQINSDPSSPASSTHSLV
jgi:mannitol-specific phosphotransferase system IIBC component